MITAQAQAVVPSGSSRRADEQPGNAEHGTAELHGLIAAGLEHHRAGKLEEAASHYDAALRLAPGDGQLWKLAGILALQRQDSEDAVRKLEAAERLLQDDPDLYCPLSMARRERGDHAGAVEAARRAITLRPEDGEGHLALGRALLWRREFDGAVAALTRAHTLASDRPEGLRFLAFALAGAGRTGQAIAAFQAVLEGDPGDSEALNELGLCLERTGDGEGAIRCFALAAQRRPGYADPLVNYANILAERNDLADALLLTDHAHAGDPGSVRALYNRATYLDALQRWEEALDDYDRVLAIDPAHLDARWNKTLLSLKLGSLEAGWDLYEKRWQMPAAYRQAIAAPLWAGEPLDGRTVLLQAEQGLGDTLQFVRYAPLIAARGGQVILECRKPLVRLLTGHPGLAAIVARGEELPACDVYLPIMSAPHRLRTTLETIPPVCPYQAILPASLQRDGGVNVGLVWAGSSGHANDAHRSIPFALLEPLLGIPGTRCFSLQVDAAVPGRHDLIDLGSTFEDFADTARAVAALDLVICVDTSIAHLAGTLGTPTLLLLPTRSDWRWLVGREDTPWYPGMRLLRQQHPGDWAGVVGVAAAIVRRIVEARRCERGDAGGTVPA